MFCRKLVFPGTSKTLLVENSIVSRQLVRFGQSARAGSTQRMSAVIRLGATPLVDNWLSFVTFQPFASLMP